MVNSEVSETPAVALRHMTRLMNQFRECCPAGMRLADEIPTTIVPASLIISVCQYLRDDPHLQYSFLAELNAIDYVGRSDRFDITYILHSFVHNTRLRLKVRVGGDEPEVPSVVSLWPAATWHEREIYDLFGVKFAGHPDLRRILLPDDWEGHPLRRDEPQGDEPVSFTEEEAGIERDGPVLHRSG